MEVAQTNFVTHLIITLQLYIPFISLVFSVRTVDYGKNEDP